MQSVFVCVFVQMNSKRQLKPTSQEAKSNVWKVKPPCSEQLELERMFKSNEIGPSASADSIRRSNPMFLRFSSQVFGNHFRTTKAKLGGCGNIFIYFYNVRSTD